MDKETPARETPRTVKSVRRALNILETIREMDGAKLTELVSEYDLAKSTIHSHVSTLEEEGYLVKDGDEYRISALFVRLGEHARTCRPEYQMASDAVKKVAEQSEECSQFAIEERQRVVFLYRRDGAHAVNTGIVIGRRRYMHTNAVGKAILAHLPDERIENIIQDCGLPKVTENTITDEAELYEEIELIRDRGYSVNIEENITGLCAVGAPIKRDNGEVIGGISVSGPAHRLNNGRLHGELADLIRGEANELELDIKYS